MKTTELNAFVREETGKRSNKNLRKEGKVPAVIYDNSVASHIYVDAKEMRKVIYTPDTYIVTLSVDGNAINVIIRETQFHPVKEYLQHVDFLRISEDKAVEVVLPIKMVGTPVGVGTGGKLTIKLRKVKVKGIPAKLPEYIEIDVSGLELGSTIKLDEVDFGEIKVVTPISTAVASVEIPRSLRSAQDEQGEEGEGGEGETEAEAEE